MGGHTSHMVDQDLVVPTAGSGALGQSTISGQTDQQQNNKWAVPRVLYLPG